ncbi:hypothetical protein Plhal304r1_c004g0015171 [Plasmopara halstedii]
MLPKGMRKDGNTATSVTAATAICNLCELYTGNSLDGKWTELAELYDQRRNVDNYREILDLSAPTARMSELNGWHLERIAVGEFESRSGTSVDDLTEIKRKSRMIKQMLKKVLANGYSYKLKRDELDIAMIKQREALTAELTEAKEFFDIQGGGATTTQDKPFKYIAIAVLMKLFLRLHRALLASHSLSTYRLRYAVIVYWWVESSFGAFWPFQNTKT